MIEECPTHRSAASDEVFNIPEQARRHVVDVVRFGPLSHQVSWLYEGCACLGPSNSDEELIPRLARARDYNQDDRRKICLRGPTLPRPECGLGFTVGIPLVWKSFHRKVEFLRTE